MNRPSLPRTEETNTSEGEGTSDAIHNNIIATSLKRYELAIKCYTEAIEKCPADKEIDLATFHQNRSDVLMHLKKTQSTVKHLRAAAHDQLDDLDSVISDCDIAVKLNNKYVKALDRRAKTVRKQAMQVSAE